MVGLAISVTGGKMWLTWSQIVAVFILTSPCTGSYSPKSVGTEFITAYMENMAYYKLGHQTHRLYIAALKSGTQVNVTVADQSFRQTFGMTAGQTYDVSLPGTVELGNSNSSFKTVYVTSSFPVTVYTVNSKEHSIDTGMVQPVENLGTEYRLSSPAAPTDQLYQFIVINTQQANTVTVTQPSQEAVTVALGPYENARFRAAKSPDSTLVTSQAPVAVLFGHPCKETAQCKCGLAFEQLTPVSSWGSVFIVPSLSLPHHGNQSLLIVTSDGSSPKGILPSEYPASPNANPVGLEGDSLYIQAPMPVSIHLLDAGVMTLIPEESFSTCYLVQTVPGANNFILIVVKTADKEGVQLGRGPLPSNMKWAEVPESDYSVGLLQLWLVNLDRVVWHLTSKMGVYNIGEYSSMIYASPALSLKVEPDGSKCRAYLGKVQMVDEEKSWADAQEHCWNLNSQLASLNSLAFLEHTGRVVGATHRSAAWVGLRRSLLSETRYPPDQPGTPSQRT